MLKELLKKREFAKGIRECLRKEGVLDVILLGSVTKGKELPVDIDLLVLHTLSMKEAMEMGYKLRKDISFLDKRIDVIVKSYDEIFAQEFLARESILSGGFSFRYNRFISECFGYKGFVLFKYLLKKMSKSRRMQFYYSLYGRGKGEGILKKNRCYKFSDNLIISPIDTSETIKAFLDSWHIEYLDFPILIPERIARYRL